MKELNLDKIAEFCRDGFRIGSHWYHWWQGFESKRDFLATRIAFGS